KRRLPNKQWELLQLLATYNGELSWHDKGATEKIKKKKQLLSDTLKQYFQIDDDPFYPYKKLNAYKIKITLIPESGRDIKEKKSSQLIPDADIRDLLTDETQGSY
ncbi:MAG TPA: hypothetical protein VK338_02895, partial [Candidatus Nitrosocosmicus sp.]|nr:hypothetical protein [Candidatus Nitrosocosmicus sp.]